MMYQVDDNNDYLIQIHIREPGAREAKNVRDLILNALDGNNLALRHVKVERATVLIACGGEVL